MIRARSTLFLLAGVLLLSGCSTGGEDKYSTSYVQSHITQGVTTQAQVQSLYGVPDDNEKSSQGTTWVYYKNGNMDNASSLVGYIPGASAISSAFGMANTASSASDSVSKVTNKSSGNTEIHGKRLYITFNNQNIVDYWSLH